MAHEPTLWVKKIGDIHYAGHNTTLCGIPMLGNNYAAHYPELDKQMHYKREACKKCKQIFDNQTKQIS